MKVDKEWHALIKQNQEQMLKHQLWYSCLNCDFWDKKCTKFNMLPPPEIIVHGCKFWEDTIPF